VTGIVFLAPVAGGTGNLTVTGTGSALNAQNSVAIGGSGTTAGGAGTLNVNAGGSVAIAGSLFVYPPGAVNLNGGTLTAAALANAIAGSAGPVTTTAGSTINITNGGGATFSGQIGGGGSIVKTGAGTQFLAGANTYSGGTTVSAGALGVTNVAGSGTGIGPVNIGSTAFLGGSGTITGPVNVASGGTLTGGLTGTAALTLAGAVSMGSGSTVSIGIGGTTPGSGAGGHDQINLGTTGTINLGGSNLSAGVTYAPANTDVVQFILGTGTGQQVMGSFANAPPGTQFPLGTFMGQPYAATINYTPNVVFFNNFVPVPEAGSVLLMCAGVGLIASRLRLSVRSLSRKRQQS
jgi:fibronectin-binding autotransporter adhesin